VTDPSERDEPERDEAETAVPETASEAAAEDASGDAGAESAESGSAGDESAEPESSDAPATADGEVSGEATTGNGEASDEPMTADGETTSGDDDLPEWEPLTPELVEDEAIRGDFMLRWAVILLALLLGCREISETTSLVRIKTGQYLASNGLLPPSSDVFSYTATERPWVNTAWLFDLIVGGVYGVGGAIGVSLLTALIAAATLYFVVHISRPELPTWWTAFCAGVALFILQVEFTALPEIVTLLGVAWMLRGLVNWSQTGHRASLWCVAGSLAVWGNLDPRAFIGWIILAAYALGTVIGDAVGRRTRHGNAASKDLGIAVVAGLAALMVNPFGWQTLLAPISYYTVRLPALVEYLGYGDLLIHPLYEARLWQPVSPVIAVGVAILGLALLTSIANLRRLDPGLLLSFLTVSGLAVLCSHELAVATLAGVVLAALNGQDWYRANCRVEYSTATLEVLWSRAGRALTVLALAAFAWLAVSGRLMGKDGKRIGVGFAPQLVTNISGLEQDLEAVGDERIFVFRLEQGDLLLWLGRPTFVDSRVEVYAGGEDDILLLHNKARHALRRIDPASIQRSAAGTGDISAEVAAGSTAADDDPSTWFGRRELWVDTFDRFNVQLAVPRLWGVTPDAQTWVDLENSPDWTQVSLGATSAFFARTTAPPPVEGEPVPEGRPLRLDFVQKAFRDCWTPQVEVERIDWPRPRTAYQNFLSLPPNPSSVPILRARRHADWLALGGSGAVPVTSFEALAIAMLIMRDANAALDDNVNNVEGYHLQANASDTLAQLEAGVLAVTGQTEVNQQQHMRKMYALHQALILEPENMNLTTAIGNEYFQRQRWDLALEMINRTLDLIRALANPNEQALTVAQQLSQAKRELEPRIEAMARQLEQSLADPDADIRNLIVALAQQGYPRKALELYDEHRLKFAGDLMTELQGAYLYAECGRLEDAEAAFATFESIPDDPLVSYQWVLQAAWLKMARGEHESAIALCQRRLRDVERSAANALLGLSSFVQPIPGYLGERQIWPSTLTLATSRALYDTREETTQLRWTIAMAMIEAGLCPDAANVLHDLLDSEPQTRLRSLVGLWVRLLTGESIPDVPRTEVVPILIQDGPEEPVVSPESGSDEKQP
jgi:tetratricopeptide (TPR) repeat protein